MAASAASESDGVCTGMDRGDQENRGAVFCDGQLSFLGGGLREIPGQLIADYAHRTVRLDLSFNQIQSLRGLERFTQLTELIVDNNDLGDDVIFPRMASLTTLCLNKNRFVELDALLAQLKVKVPHLHYLSLLGNAACPNQLSSRDHDDEDYQRYRHYVLFHLPHLQFLDSSAVGGEEQQEARRRGQFLQVVRPPPSQQEPCEQSSPPHSAYTPLPSGGDHDKDNVQPLGFYSKSTTAYLGRQSEGNRFIRSKDL